MELAGTAQRYDVAVLGAGIVGLAVARELAARRPGSRIVVLDRERRIATHQSSHNSGVVHAGVYYEPGSLKARLCVEGSRELIAYCRERGIAVRENGKLIVATSEPELGRLDELERRARANGVRGLERIGAAGIAAIEPAARGLDALHSPHTAVVDYAEVARSYAAELEAGGAELELGHGVADARERGDGVELELDDRRRIEAARLVVCAGAFGEPLASRLGLTGAEVRLVPFRGAYLELRAEHRGLVRGNVYPVPDPDLPFLGAHLTKGVDGRVLLGPTALLAGAPDAYRLGRLDPASVASTLGWPGSRLLALRHRRAALLELSHALVPALLVRAARRMVPALRRAQFVPGPAGVRGQALGRDGALIDDFLIERSERALVVRNAPSPAATSSLALARLIADELGALPG